MSSIKSPLLVAKINMIIYTASPWPLMEINIRSSHFSQAGREMINPTQRIKSSLKYRALSGGVKGRIRIQMHQQYSHNTTN